MTKISVIHSDITQQNVDAIVNAANSTLLGGGGIDGAIHHAAGPELMVECSTLGGCNTGEAKITKGYALTAKFVIHTVGPIYGSEGGRENELLQSCYINSLERAREVGARTVVFPAISTGVFRFPKDKAAKIAFDTVQTYIDSFPDDFDEILFVVFSEIDKKIYDCILQGKEFTIVM